MSKKLRTEGDLITINEWLLPLSWLFGLCVRLRNQLFELGVLRQRAFDIPIISVGNITVGGSGKTPHVEYLIELLHRKMQVGVLSRGYKRKSHGYVLADRNTPMEDIGDEPYQMKRKYPDTYVAVDGNRCEGISRMTGDEATKDVDVILLDDAFQHRYVKPGINILLVDYHRLIIYDKLLPAGRLREPLSGKNRADVVIVTKCPKDLKPMEFRVLTKALDLFPYQRLYFTCIDYLRLKPVFAESRYRKRDTAHKERNKDASTKEEERDEDSKFDPKDLAGYHVLLLTGIASPQQMENDLRPYCHSLQCLSFSDHHNFSIKDTHRINTVLAAMPEPRMIVTTEKDASRLLAAEGLSDEVKKATCALPITVHFLLEQEEAFNHNIINYVHKNSRNSILVKDKDDHNTEDRHHSGHGPRTISFRNN